MPEKVNILDVRFDNVLLDEAVDLILNCEKKGYVCTPNPEMILEAQKNDQFLNVLNDSLLNIPDGIGVLWAATQIYNKNSKFKAIFDLPLISIIPKRFKNVLRERVTGVDLLQKICSKVVKKDLKIFFLGAGPGIAEKAAEILEERFPGLKIVGTFAGSPLNEHRKEIVNIINHSAPDILFVAYGAPKQEIWLADNLKHLKTVKIGIGVGGSFDFITGKQKRAPKFMQKLGLEWLYRVIQEPMRIKRIFNATIKFPIEVIKKL